MASIMDHKNEFLEKLKLHPHQLQDQDIYFCNKQLEKILDNIKAILTGLYC